MLNIQSIYNWKQINSFLVLYSHKPFNQKFFIIEIICQSLSLSVFSLLDLYLFVAYWLNYLNLSVNFSYFSILISFFEFFFMQGSLKNPYLSWSKFWLNVLSACFSLILFLIPLPEFSFSLWTFIDDYNGF